MGLREAIAGEDLGDIARLVKSKLERHACVCVGQGGHRPSVVGGDHDTRDPGSSAVGNQTASAK
jgi:hypothetical protein